MQRLTVPLSVSLTILLGTSPHTVAAGDLVDGDNKLQVTAIVSGQRVGPFEVNCQRTPGGTTTTIQHSGKGQLYTMHYHPTSFLESTWGAPCAAAEVVGPNVVFTWQSTGATGLTYKCSLNGAAQVDCELMTQFKYLLLVPCQLPSNPLPLCSLSLQVPLLIRSHLPASSKGRTC